MKKLRALLLILVLLQTGSLLFAENDQKLVRLGHDVYSALTALYLEQGLAPPSTSGPYSVAELREYLARIDRSTLSPAGLRAYAYVQTFLTHRVRASDDKGNLQFNTDPTVTIAGYAQTNPNAAPSQEPQWLQRPPLVSIPLEVWLFNSFYADIEPEILIDRFEAQLPAGGSGTAYSFNPTNVPLSLAQVDFNIPYRAFMSLGGRHWNVDLGRFKLSWGNGAFGNLMLSPNSDFYDNVRFSTFWKNFKYTAVYISLPPYWPGFTPPYPTALPGGWASDQATTSGIPDPYKAFFGHRLEFRIGKRVTTAISEAVVFGGAYPQLSDFNPLMVFHNWFIPWRAKSLATAELSVNPFKWLVLYGQLAVFNFRNFEYSEYTSATTIPNALGYFGGAKGSFPLGQGYLTAAFQWTKTDPWLYIGGNDSSGNSYYNQPWLSYTMDEYYTSNVLGTKTLVEWPLGWYYGPDTIVWNASLAYQVYGKYKAGAELRIEQQGINTIDTAFRLGPSATSMIAVQDTPFPIDTQVVHLFGSWLVGRLLSADWTVGGDIFLVNVQNINHVSGDKSFNVQFVGSLSLKY